MGGLTMAPFPRGALVRTWFDEGCGPGGYVYGVVTKAGPRTFTVRWESGIVQRRHQGIRQLASADPLTPALRNAQHSVANSGDAPSDARRGVGVAPQRDGGLDRPGVVAPGDGPPRGAKAVDHVTSALSGRWIVGPNVELQLPQPVGMSSARRTPAGAR
jgi:hypothetical protein